MDLSNICQLNAAEILENARSFASLQEYGKSCSYFMFLFYREHSCLNYKQEFLFVFTKWIEKLIKMGQLLELTRFMETVFENCQPIKTDIALCASEILYKNNCIYHAADVLNMCQDQNDYRVTDLLERLNNLMVDKWHFRMLNDKKRNSAYALALQHAFERGHRSVLDIGSGTGLLSLLSRRAGFEKVMSCESSSVMCYIQENVLDANNEKEICLLKKMSTYLKVGEDIEDRVSLVVTEIFDCALLGEGVIATLKHAWDKLLSSNKLSEVLPHSATVYGVCVECEEVRKHAKYSLNNIFLRGNQDTCDEECQPYTTENISSIKGGYKVLSQEFIVMKIDFNSFEQLNNCEKNFLLEVDMIENGLFDAVMLYFVLNLDESIKICTKPDEGSCWEQAIYTNYSSPQVKPGSVVSLNLIIREDCISINFENIEENSVNLGSSKDSNVNNLRVFDIDRRLVARQNDCDYIERYIQCLSWKIGYSKEVLNICFICADISIIPLLVSQKGDHMLSFVEPTAALLNLLVYADPSLNKRTQVLTRPLVDNLQGIKKFDVVISEPIDCNGLIKDNFVEDMATIKSLACSNETSFIPSRLDCFGMCISSDQLVRENQVVDNTATLGLSIAEHINKFKVSTHPDVEGASLKHEVLSSTFPCFGLDFSAPIINEKDLDSFFFSESNIDVNIENNGNFTAVLLWFDIYFGDRSKLSTGPSMKTHFHQTCLILPNNENVSTKQIISLLVSRYKNYIGIRQV